MRRATRRRIAAGAASPASRRRPLAYLLVYRSAVLAGDTQAIEALAAALRARGIAPLVLAVSSLKDPEAVAVVRRAIASAPPDVDRDHHRLLGPRR